MTINRDSAEHYITYYKEYKLIHGGGKTDREYIFHDHNGIYTCHHNLDISTSVEAIEETHIEDLHKFQKKRLI